MPDCVCLNGLALAYLVDNCVTVSSVANRQHVASVDTRTLVLRRTRTAGYSVPQNSQFQHSYELSARNPPRCVCQTLKSELRYVHIGCGALRSCAVRVSRGMRQKSG